MDKTDVFLLSKNIAYKVAIHFGLAVSGSAAGIKLAKKWYLQQKENTMLAGLEAANKIKLLKSQTKPEFLFHSLKNLQKKIREASPEAPVMILYLSEIFSYILYDCDGERVPLQKELLALKYLMEVKKINQASGLVVSLEVNGSITGKYISPLLLFSVFQRMYVEDEKTTGSGRVDITINAGDIFLDLLIQQDASTVVTNKAGKEKLITELLQNLPAGYLLRAEAGDNNITVRLLLSHNSLNAVQGYQNSIQEYADI